MQSKPKISAEEWVAKVNEIIAKFRASTVTLEDAIKELREFDLCEGEAILWLMPQKKRKP